MLSSSSWNWAYSFIVRLLASVKSNTTNPNRPADDDTSFLTYQPFKDAATNAALPANVPQGYSLAFQNLQASSQTTTFLGVKTIDSYDPVTCASICDQQDGCVAFNLYFERDPTLAPNTTNCPNPPSSTNIKCVKWGVHIEGATATNKGEHRGMVLGKSQPKLAANRFHRQLPCSDQWQQWIQQGRSSSCPDRLHGSRRTWRFH